MGPLNFQTILTTHADNSRSNKIKVVKTPGGVLRAQHVKKNGTRPKCGDCGIALPGISSLRPREYAQVSKTHKTVSRAYGGSRCANCVKERIVRAFLIEEQKIVKRVLKEQAEKEKKAEKKATKSKK
jgi:large subunit ribosomal protein L34e